MEKKFETIEDKIMNQIQCGDVKLRSKSLFLAEKFGLRSAFILSILLGVCAFMLFLFYVRATDNLIYLSFGRVGLLAFLESFPYLLVIGFIVLIFVAGMIIKKSELFYKFPFAYSAVSLLGVVLVAGSVLAYTHIPEFIEDEGYLPGAPGGFIRPFLHNCFMERNHGISGEIIEVQGNSLILQTPDGIRRVVFPQMLSQEAFARGKFVIIVGDRIGDEFQAHLIRIIDEQRIPMIHRGVKHRFPNESFFLPGLKKLLQGLI